MKDNAVVPALSVDGWVEQPMGVASYLFSHLFLSDFSQSYLYYGHVTSIAYLLYKNQSSVDELARDIQFTVTEYFGRYYDTVNCEVVDSSGTGTSGTITMHLELMDGNDTYTLDKVINYTDSKVKSILDYNNFGIESSKLL